jgi:hypothetical protein
VREREGAAIVNYMCNHPNKLAPKASILHLWNMHNALGDMSNVPINFFVMGQSKWLLAHPNNNNIFIFLKERKKEKQA